MSLRRMPNWLAALIGVVVLLIAWWIFSLTAFQQAEGTTFNPVPAPLDVFRWLLLPDAGGTEHAPYILGAPGIFAPTLTAAGIGFLWGNGLALLLSAVVLLLPRAEPILEQIAVVSYCLPVVAVGGISIVVLGGADRPGEPSETAVLLAALSVFFTTVVGSLLGFKSADRASLDVVRVFGGSRWTQLVKVRLISALPAILNALQIAVPTSLLGAVLGEYMGGIDRGVGPTLIRLQGQLDSAGVWSIFLLAALVALAGYGIAGLISRLVTPWIRGRSRA